MELSVCIITKNEEKKLEKCLKALTVYPWEIVVVDTGSSDGSLQTAKRYGAKTADFTWVDDFAAAKNYAIGQASNEMVLVLDTDEYLEELDYEKLLRQIEAHPRAVGRLKRRNVFVADGEEKETVEYIHRIFSRELYGYQGRIHEQVVRKAAPPDSPERWGYETYYTEITILHDGYSGTEEERQEKAKRNIRLLIEAQKEEPEDPYLQYQLGKGYYMAGRYEEAVRWFDQALYYDLNPKLEYVIDMVESYGYALLKCGNPEKAQMLEGVYEEFGKSADFQFLMGLIYMNNGQFDRAVEEFVKAAGQPSARTVGANSYLAWYNAGVIRECLGDKKSAAAYYRKCGDYAKAKERLSQL
jgi:glycosyltransferase involved in cell wall biosynthesis